MAESPAADGGRGGLLEGVGWPGRRALMPGCPGMWAELLELLSSLRLGAPASDKLNLKPESLPTGKQSRTEFPLDNVPGAQPAEVCAEWPRGLPPPTPSAFWAILGAGGIQLAVHVA